MPIPRSSLWPLALLAGCLATQDERIVVQRDPEDLLRKRAVAKLSYAEFLEGRINEAQALEWDLGLPTAREQEGAEGARLPTEHLYSAVPQWGIRESLTHDEHTRAHVRDVLAPIPEDPWRAYELERRAVLWKDWGDRHTNQPKELEPDTDGPPGWIGPRAAPAIEVPIKKPEDGAEAAPAAEGGEE